MNSIQGFTPVRHIELPSLPAVEKAPQPGGDFSSILKGAIQQVEASSNNAQQMVEQFLSGEKEDIHTVALSGQRAELQFELFQQVRNKVVQAYQEIMRTQL